CAEGLQAAHQAGLVHRDIKPANIWLEARSEALPSGAGGGAVSEGPRGDRREHRAAERPMTGGRGKILDFGPARAATGGAGLTQPGAIVGTPAYMSPEQAHGQPIDHSTDLFSLGCVLYRLCTGRLPFRGADAIATLVAVATEQPPPPSALAPELPPELSDLVM